MNKLMNFRLGVSPCYIRVNNQTPAYISNPLFKTHNKMQTKTGVYISKEQIRTYLAILVIFCKTAPLAFLKNGDDLSWQE